MRLVSASWFLRFIRIEFGFFFLFFFLKISFSSFNVWFVGNLSLPFSFCLHFYEIISVLANKFFFYNYGVSRLTKVNSKKFLVTFFKINFIFLFSLFNIWFFNNWASLFYWVFFQWGYPFNTTKLEILHLVCGGFGPSFFYLFFIFFL